MFGGLDNFLELILLWVFAAPLVGLAALIFALRQRALLDDVRRRMAALTEETARLRREVTALREMPAAPPVPETAPPRPTIAEVLAAPVAPEAPPPAPVRKPAAVAPPPAPAPARESVEQRLTSRWLLWLGALALGLGGVFLVKYAADAGLLGPPARVALGVLIGGALMAAGEWARHHGGAATGRTDYVPPALSAAGVSIAYSALFAAFDLYHLLPPLLAFLALGAVSVGAVLLAVPQGPLVALLGVIGGFVTPALVGSDHPSAWGLFVFLLFLTAAGLWMLRYTRAVWLGAATLAGALLWPALWLAAFFGAHDGAAVGTYLIALAAMAVFVPSPSLLAADAPPLGARRPGAAAILAWVALAAIAILVFALLRMDRYGEASRGALFGFVALCLFLAWRAPGFDLAAPLALLPVLAGIAAWYIPRLIVGGPAVGSFSPFAIGTALPAPPGAAVALPALPRFLGTTFVFALAFAATGYAWFRRAPRPAVWAGLSAAAPVLLFAVAYWRVEDFRLSLNWAAIALALAAAMVAAAARVRREGGPAVALAAYAAAAIAALSLGAAMTLREAWLTVALAIELPALGWIAVRLMLPQLRFVAGVVAAAVLIRLAANPDLSAYPIVPGAAFSWLLYGYGIPAIAFFAAARLFARLRDDWLITLLEGGALAFAALLGTLEIHNILLGPVGTRYGLLEPCLQTIVWLAIALGLDARPQWAARPVALWGRRALSGLAVAQIVLVLLLWRNPLWSYEPVGTLPVLNLLLLAYGVPAALLALQLRGAPPRRTWTWVRRALVLVLLFAEISLEVRHLYHGSVLVGGRTSDAEWYAYSAAWLLFAGGLLAIGIRGGSVAVRYGALAVLLVVVLKVFLSDMAALTGLLRVASFFGLGLALIGVGYLYQRVVFPPAGPPKRPA
ncbi:MAG: DUF2339 domain-containing protein [Rhodospirillales bacterium]|nr:DUF2339 domain-containing protein [Rhodospirillales bacterium]